MASYVIIESRDPFDAVGMNGVNETLALAGQLAKQKDDVVLFLVGNGVGAARPSERSRAFAEVAQAGVKILADDFSLAERGIKNLAPQIAASPIDTVVDALARGAKTLWR
jgi:predicted peroxiredoxin